MIRIVLLASKNPIEVWFGNSIRNPYLRLAIIDQTDSGFLFYPFPFRSIGSHQVVKVSWDKLMDSDQYYKIQYYSYFYTNINIDPRKYSSPIMSMDEWCRRFLLGEISPENNITSYSIVNALINENFDDKRYLAFTLQLPEKYCGDLITIRDDNYNIGGIPSEIASIMDKIIRNPELNYKYINTMQEYSCRNRSSQQYIESLDAHNNYISQQLRNGLLQTDSMPQGYRYEHSIFVTSDGTNYLHKRVDAINNLWERWLEKINNKHNVAVILPLEEILDQIYQLNVVVFGQHGPCEKLLSPRIKEPRRIYLARQDRSNNLPIIIDDDFDKLETLETAVLLEILQTLSIRENSDFVLRLSTHISKIISSRVQGI